MEPTPQTQSPHWQELAKPMGNVLRAIKHAEDTKDYNNRNNLIFFAVSMAQEGGLAAGVRIDPAEPDWPVLFIELPTGQVSWHVPAHSQPWDGHTTEEKYRRVDAFLASLEAEAVNS